MLFIYDQTTLSRIIQFYMNERYNENQRIPHCRKNKDNHKIVLSYEHVTVLYMSRSRYKYLAFLDHHFSEENFNVLILYR